MFKQLRNWLVLTLLLLAGWTGLVARFAPQVEAELGVQRSLMILLPAAWRDWKPSMPGTQRL